MAGGELWVTENARSAIMKVEEGETGDAAGFLVGVVGVLYFMYLGRSYRTGLLSRTAS